MVKENANDLSRIFKLKLNDLYAKVAFSYRFVSLNFHSAEKLNIFFTFKDSK